MAQPDTDGETPQDMIDALHHVRLPLVDEPPVAEVRHGFLPFDTNAFDRGFISALLLIAIHLLWMRFLEASLPLGIATVLSLVLAVVIFRKG